MANLFEQASSIVRKRLQDALGFANQVETNRRNFVGGLGNNIQQGANSYNNFANNTFRTLEDITGAREGVKSALRIGLQNPISQARLKDNNVYAQRTRQLLNTDNPVNIGDVGNVAKFGSNFLGISPLVKSATTLKGLAGIGGTTAFGAGLGSMMNENRLEGAKQGALGTLQSLPQIYGVTRFTNPLINNTASKIASKITSPIGSALARRTTAGLSNIPEGMAINTATGNPKYDLMNAGIDFGTGFLTGGADAPRNLTKQELEIDIRRQKNQEINKQIEKLMASGKSENHPAVKAFRKEYKNNILKIQKLSSSAMNIYAGESATGFKNAENKFTNLTDKKTRFEIDDSKAKIKNTNMFNSEDKLKNLYTEARPLTDKWWSGKTTPEEVARLDKLSNEINKLENNVKSGSNLMLKDILDHKELFKQYPETQDIKVKLSTLESLQGRGNFSPETNTISINKDLLKNDPEQAKSVILHEIQHNIQTKEGFANGGNPSMFDPRESLSESLSPNRLDPFQKYRNLAGEVEARDVQARVNLNSKQRRQVLPYSSENIPLKDQIVRFDNNVSNSIDAVKGKQKEFYINIYDTKGNSTFSKVEGKKIDLGNKNIEAFLHKNPNGGWGVSEIQSGMSLTGREGKRTQKEAIDAAKTALNDYKGDVRELIKKATDTYGYSPSYKQPVVNTNNVMQKEVLGNAQVMKTQLPIENKLMKQNQELQTPISTQINDGQYVPDPLPKDIPEPDFLKENPDLGVKIKQPSPAPEYQTTENAQMQGDIINAGNEIFKSLPDDIKLRTQDWINARNTAKNIEGYQAKLPFRKFNDGGLNTIIDFQTNSNKPEYAEIKSYFDNKYNQLSEAGVDLGYEKDYLPQLWANSKQEVEKVFNGKRLSMKPSFTLEKVIEDYKTGIKAGLVPKFSTISDLVSWYESYANKALADKAYFTDMLSSGSVMPSSKAPSNWAQINNFPKYVSKFGDREYQGSYSAPEPLAKIINNYLGQGSEFLQNIAKGTSRTKQITLTGGIPKTGINAHGLNILARNTLAEKNPIMGFIRATYYILNPNAAEKSLQNDLKDANFFSRRGLTISAEDSEFVRVENKSANKIIGAGQTAYAWQENLLANPLFKKVIPALKVNSAKQIYNDLIKSGLNEDQAGRKASEIVNNIYGGINTEQMFRNRDFQNALRIIFLAPDWAETNLRLGGNIIKSFTKDIANPQFKAYRRIGANLMASYIGFNILNKVMSGHYAFENGDGQAFNLDTGSYTEDGKKRYVRVYGTAADFARLPYDIVSGLARGDVTNVAKTVSNRLSTPIASTVRIVANTDYLGRPLYGKDKYGNPIPLQQQAGNIGNEVLGVTGFPNYLRAPVDVATGRQNLEQGVVNALELPIRYKGGAYTDKQKEAVQTMKNEGKTGQNIFDLMQGTKGINLSDAEKEEGELNTYEKGIVKAELIKDNLSFKKVGNRVYFIDGDSLKSVSTDVNVVKPRFTNSAILNKKILSKYQSELTSKMNDIVKLEELKVITTEEADALLNQLTALHTLAGKYNKSTGKKSGRKGKIPNVKKNYKSAKVKAPTLKTKATAKLKLPKINSSYVLNNLPQSQLKAIKPIVAKMPLKIDPRILRNAKV